MINLRIASYSSNELSWQNQLKEWCVAHQVSIDPALSEPEIREGGKTVVGVTAINQFLEEYKGFMDDWYDCRCDKWMDE